MFVLKASTKYHAIATIALLLALALCGGSWLWADASFRSGAVRTAYWIGVAGSALPALTLAGCLLWLGLNADPESGAATRTWVKPVLALSLLFLAFMVVFPLL